MRRLHKRIAIVCSILIAFNLITLLDLKTSKAEDAQGAIGFVTVFLITCGITAIVTGALFLWAIISSVIHKKIPDKTTLLIVGLTIFTFFFPWILLGFL